MQRRPGNNKIETEEIGEGGKSTGDGVDELAIDEELGELYLDLRHLELIAVALATHA